jgi:hypothetical protein
MVRNFIFLWVLGLTLNFTPVYAFKDRQVTLPGDFLVSYAPHIFNTKSMMAELGFLTQKEFESIGYNYNAFVKLSMMEEFYRQDPSLRAASLGVKGGVLLPTQPWLPLMLNLGIGFSKTTIHERPWFGNRDKAVLRQEMVMGEAGLLWHHRQRYFLRGTYHINNRKTFKRNFFFSLGANF